MWIRVKQILVEIDDRVARDRERVAPTKARERAQFIRAAIRRAVDLALARGELAARADRAAPGECAGVAAAIAAVVVEPMRGAASARR